MKKIVLIGAGSAQFGADTIGDLSTSDVVADACVVLHDIDAAALDRTFHKAQNFAGENELDLVLQATTDRKQALKGADFVIISIEVGDRFALWDIDWWTPQRFGITQIYGENGGPGGLFHSLRIIPPILEIVQDIMDICPEAYVFNYSNPMSKICTAVNRKFPDCRFIGLCHEIASIEKHLPKMLEVPFEEIAYTCGGLNHFSVLLDARYKSTGKDAYKDIRARAASYFETQHGYSEYLEHSRLTGALLETEGAGEDVALDERIVPRRFSDRHLFMHVLDNFGYLPITTDSHFGEYLGWAHEVADTRGIVDFFTYYRKLLNTRSAEITRNRKERAVYLIDAIVSDTALEEPAVNIPNDDLIHQLPAFIAVEVPATVNGKGVRGRRVEIPSGIAGLLTNQIGIHDLTADAAIHGSRELALQALMVDPIVNRASIAREMLETVISMQAPYLDYLR